MLIILPHGFYIRKIDDLSNAYMTTRKVKRHKCLKKTDGDSGQNVRACSSAWKQHMRLCNWSTRLIGFPPRSWGRRFESGQAHHYLNEFLWFGHRRPLGLEY